MPEAQEPRRRRITRPNGAYKLLVSLMYGHYPSFLEVLPKQSVQLKSIRKLARILGTQSSRVNQWLLWLEDQGFIDSLSWSENRRQARFRIRKAPNVTF